MFRKRKKVTHPPHGAERSHRFSLNWVLGFWKPAMENIMPSDVDHVANFESSTMQDSSSDEYVSRRSLISLPPNSLAVMPNEILEIIFGYLLQQAIYSLTLTNSRFAEIATFHLYDEPIFASTYRFAQVSTNSILAHISFSEAFLTTISSCTWFPTTRNTHS